MQILLCAVEFDGFVLNQKNGQGHPERTVQIGWDILICPEWPEEG